MFEKKGYKMSFENKLYMVKDSNSVSIQSS